MWFLFLVNIKYQTLNQSNIKSKINNSHLFKNHMTISITLLLQQSRPGMMRLT